MRRTAASALVVIAAGLTCAGCASAPSATYHAAGVSAYTVRTTSVDLYHGAGQALRAPLRDLNMMQEQIAPVLLRAEDHPYDLARVDSCNDVLDKVAELDLALGPDVDMPKQGRRTRADRGADFAADAALDAAGTAVEHFIPLRGTIKQISGAQRYENHVKHAVLAGEVRRSFLKAVGMAHSCAWPAAPLAFHPAQVADANASWSGGSIQYAAANATPAAAASAPIQPALLTTGGQSSTARAGLQPFPILAYAAVPLPPARPPAIDVTQTWRPAPSATPQRAATQVAIAAPHAAATSARIATAGPSMNHQGANATGIARASAPLSAASAASSAANAPWSAGFATSH